MTGKVPASTRRRRTRESAAGKGASYCQPVVSFIHTDTPQTAHTHRTKHKERYGCSPRRHCWKCQLGRPGCDTGPPRGWPLSTVAHNGGSQTSWSRGSTVVTPHTSHSLLSPHTPSPSCAIGEGSWDCCVTRSPRPLKASVRFNFHYISYMRNARPETCHIVAKASRKRNDQRAPPRVGSHRSQPISAHK